MTKKYKIEVDCANCANKMEEQINKLKGIENATINFMTSKLIIKFEENADIDKILLFIEQICKKIDSDFIIEK